MTKTELRREEFEEALGFKICDWQWEYIKAFANSSKKIQWVQGRRGGRYEIAENLKEAMVDDQSDRVVALLDNFKAKPFYWQEYINKIDIPSVQNLKEEFEQLRRAGPKWSDAQLSRILHIEEHLDKGDLVCRCYEGGPMTDGG